MKSVLISIRPKWCELIANSKKTVEVRKTKPKLDTPFKCYIYCTKGTPYLNRHNGHLYLEYNDILGGKGNGLYERLNGKVIGEFVCDKYDEFEPTNAGVRFRRFLALHETCLSLEEIRKYLNGSVGYGWRISDLVIYDKPKELGKLQKINPKAPQSWRYVEADSP